MKEVYHRLTALTWNWKVKMIQNIFWITQMKVKKIAIITLQKMTLTTDICFVIFSAWTFSIHRRIDVRPDLSLCLGLIDPIAFNNLHNCFKIIE